MPKIETNQIEETKETFEAEDVKNLKEALEQMF